MDSMDGTEETDEHKWLVYTKGETEQPIEHWLQTTPPSSIHKSSGYDWLCVRNQPSHGWADEPDLAGLFESWERLLQCSTRDINFNSIKELALNHNVKSGKWLFFSSTGGKVDHLWNLVASNIVNNSLPCNSAKVSTCDESERHVICIYNENFSDINQVLESEQAIRHMGIKAQMMYKPDVYTTLNIYQGNSFGIPAKIMSSDWDLIKGSSVVRTIQR